MKTQSIGLQNQELLLAYHRHPSLKLRNQLVELNQGLVRQIAHRMQPQCSEPYEDLEQIGYLGLIQAIERFNPQQGCAFSSFAIPYIRGEILHYLRDRGSIMRIPRRWQELYNRGQKLAKQLATSLKRQPQDQEIACALGISLQEWHECRMALQNRLPVSLDATISQLADSGLSLGDTIPDWRDQVQQQIAEERLQLEGALGKLEKTTKTAIECVFLREISRKEAARSIGMSPMTVTRHIRKGIEQLSAILEPQVA